jgi:hypothetical protein
LERTKKNRTAFPTMKRQGAKWTTVEEAKLRELANAGAHVRGIALKLRRSESSVRRRAHELGVAVKPAPRGTFRFNELKKA